MKRSSSVQATPRWRAASGVPECLRRLRQWVFLPGRQGRYEQPGSQPPLSPVKGSHASLADPGDWDTYDNAHLANRLMGGRGVAFVLSEGDPFLAVVTRTDGPLPEFTGHCEIPNDINRTFNVVLGELGIRVYFLQAPEPCTVWYYSETEDYGVVGARAVVPVALGHHSHRPCGIVQLKQTPLAWRTPEHIGDWPELVSAAPHLFGPLATCGSAEPVRIRVDNGELPRMTDEAMAALTAHDRMRRLFLSSAGLVRVDTISGHTATSQPLRPDTMRGMLARAVTFIAHTHSGPKEVLPPACVVKDILALEPERLGKHFPFLREISSVPILREDGSLKTTPGYDIATECYYGPSVSLASMRLPKTVGPREAADAAFCLLDVLCDFPFVSAEDRANALALVLTPLIPRGDRGSVPFTVINATKPGTGKSLLAEVFATILTGRSAEMIPPPGSQEEWRKLFTSVLGDDSPFVVIDNVTDPVCSTALAVTATARVYKDRRLGSNTCTVHRNPKCVVITGNHVSVVGDLRRRCLWVNLDAGMAEPWTRSSFRHPDLLHYVSEHRTELVAAALTMVRAWIVAGRPQACVKPFGSFERWAASVASILKFCGVDGFGGWRSHCPKPSTRVEKSLAASAGQYA